MSDLPESLLTFLNLFFFGFHFLLIIFNLTGWIFPNLRKWHLLSMLLVAFSWFGLGLIYGMGYCFITDWHFEVRRELGLGVDSQSYIHFLLKRIHLDFWSAQTTNLITAISFAVLLILGIALNGRDYFRNK